MTDIFISSDNITSPIGLTTAENFQQLKHNVSGVKLHENKSMSDQPFQAALFGEDINQSVSKKCTRFENVLISSIADALDKTKIKSVFGITIKNWEESLNKIITIYLLI